MVKVLDESGCNDNEKYTCYSCKYWNLVDPNHGGLIDIGVCVKRLIEVDESSPICVDFEKMTLREQAAQNLIRRKMVEVMNNFREDVEQYCKRGLKEEVVDDILETIKWNIMRGIDD